MKRRLWSSLLLVALFCVLRPVSAQWSQGQNQDSSILLMSRMNAGQEVPPPTQPMVGHGMGVFYFDRNTQTLQFAIAYNNLSGPPVAAHFHEQLPGKSGPPVVDLCGNSDKPSLLGGCPSTHSGFVTGSWQVPHNLVRPLLSGQLYVNFHTAANPSGELRGQVVISHDNKYERHEYYH